MNRVSNPLRIVTQGQLTELTATASASPRLRRNLNLHPVLEDPIQRLFNAIEPGTYVRPHRHARENGWELMLAVRGAFSILTFDDEGTVLERVELGSEAGAATAAEIPPYTWHAVVVNEPGTVMFEAKPGPYCAVGDKDFAGWAPAEPAPNGERVVAWYRKARPGDRMASSQVLSSGVVDLDGTGVS
jgi:cupin fold WbuC family metalloprotein